MNTVILILHEFFCSQGNLSSRHLKGSFSVSSSSEQSTPSASPRSPHSPLLDPALQLSHQAHIRNMYGVACSSELQNSLPSVVAQPVSEILQLDSSNEKSGFYMKKNKSFTHSVNGRTSSSSFRSHNAEEGNSVEDRRGKNCKDTRALTRSSLSFTPQLKSGSLGEENIPKSVTFAEKLISEEISFESSSPRFDSGSDVGGSHIDLHFKENNPHIAMIDYRHQRDSSSAEKSKTASQLREHFEKLSLKNMCDSQLPVSDTHIIEGRNVLNDTGTENVALKILADVAVQREAVELMQKESLIKSQEASVEFYDEKRLMCQYGPVKKKSFTKAHSSLLEPSIDTSSQSLNINDKPDSHSDHLNKYHSDVSVMSPSSPQIISGTRQSQERDRNLPSGFTNTSVSRMNGGMLPSVSSSKFILPTKSHHNAPHLLCSQKQPIQPKQSAYNALFPQGGLRPPSPRSSVVTLPSDKSLPSSRQLHVGGGGRTGIGSGENSISSDNSEGAESNVQSSASSGYHSENSGFLRGQAQAFPPPTANQDKGAFTQDFVNRTLSFTCSSGSSSPYSRASNDEVGPDISASFSKTSSNPLSNVYFPSHDHVSSEKTSRRAPDSILPPAKMAGSNDHVSKKVHNHRDAALLQSLTPSVPLVKTNALQSRPESSNSFSSQYSTSSSTLSTVHRPQSLRESPRLWEQSSVPENTNGSGGNSTCQQHYNPTSNSTSCYHVQCNNKESCGFSRTSAQDRYDHPAVAYSNENCSNMDWQAVRNSFDNNVDPDEADYKTKLGNVQSIMFDSKNHSRNNSQITRGMFKSYEPISISSSGKTVPMQVIKKSTCDKRVSPVAQGDVLQECTISGVKEMSSDKSKNTDAQFQQTYLYSEKKLSPYCVLYSSKC